MLGTLWSRGLPESEPTKGLQTPPVPLPVKHQHSLQGPQLGGLPFPPSPLRPPLCSGVPRSLAVKQVAVLTVQQVLIVVPDPSCSALPRTKLWSIAAGKQLRVRASSCVCLPGCSSLHSLWTASLGSPGLPHLPVIEAETSPQPGDLLLASSGACDGLMNQLLGAGLCLHVVDEKHPRWPTCLVGGLLSGLPLAACLLQSGALFKSECPRAFYL